jgi:hypothetical protein
LAKLSIDDVCGKLKVNRMTVYTKLKAKFPSKFKNGKKTLFTNQEVSFLFKKPKTVNKKATSSRMG